MYFTETGRKYRRGLCHSTVDMRTLHASRSLPVSESAAAAVEDLFDRSVPSTYCEASTILGVRDSVEKFQAQVTVKACQLYQAQ